MFVTFNSKFQSIECWSQILFQVIIFWCYIYFSTYSINVITVCTIIIQVTYFDITYGSILMYIKILSTSFNFLTLIFNLLLTI